MSTTERMAERTVAELVTERPVRSRVLERYRLDYCCGGGEPLREACERRGLDPEAVVRELAAADEQAAAGEDDVDWSERELAELVAHIVQTHHAFLRSELPRLEAMLGKVAHAHGDAHPWTRPLEETLRSLSGELTEHMQKEEQVLFPWIRALEDGTESTATCAGHGIDAPIHMMEQEHRNAAEALDRLRELSNGYAVPADACGTFRAALDGLAELERDLHRHIHEENHVLFPRAREMVARE